MIRCSVLFQFVPACSFSTVPTSPHVFDFVLKSATAPFRVDFSLKAENDAKLALAEDKTDASIFAEISEYQPQSPEMVSQLLHRSIYT